LRLYPYINKTYRLFPSTKNSSSHKFKVHQVINETNKEISAQKSDDDGNDDDGIVFGAHGLKFYLKSFTKLLNIAQFQCDFSKNTTF